MLEGMYYLKTCVSGGYVFHEDMCYSVLSLGTSVPDIYDLIFVFLLVAIIQELVCLVLSLICRPQARERCGGGHAQ